MNMIKSALVVLLLLMPVTCFGKALIFPHLVVGGGWNFGIALECTGEYDDVVTLETYSGGVLLQRTQDTIPANGEKSFWGTNFCAYHGCGNGTFTLIVRSCSDWTFGTLIRFYNGEPIGEEAPQAMPLSPDLQSRAWTTIPPSTYYVYAGQNRCNEMDKNHWLYLREVLREMYLRYRNVPGIDPRPCLGDANSRDNCPGHPAGSHSTGVSIDMDYFTTKDNNYTQYTPNGERIQLWDGDKLINFDTERNRLFLILIKQAFPKAIALMDERIKAVCAVDLPWVKGNKPGQWNHDTHMHLYLYPKKLL